MGEAITARAGHRALISRKAKRAQALNTGWPPGAKRPLTEKG